MTSPIPTPEDARIAKVAAERAAGLLSLPIARVHDVLRGSIWRTPEGLLAREFRGRYRGYYPKCDMALWPQAVVAEVFDALAEATGDPRRALRAGARREIPA